MGHPPFLVMEALEGETLAEYLERQPQLDKSLALMIIREVAGGLAAVHAMGVVHCDVKPGNLFLVGAVGEPTGVKLIDFGFAHVMGGEVAGSGERNLVLGTAQYMAPEQVIADPVDERSDIYAFGMVLFRILTGQLPFDLDPSLDLLGHQLFSPVPPPSWLNEHIDGRLERLVLRCVQKNPQHRYSSMQELLDDLGPIESDALDVGPSSSLRRVGLGPDAYQPQSPTGLEIAQSLAHLLGVEPPATATSQGEQSPVEAMTSPTLPVDEVRT